MKPSAVRRWQGSEPVLRGVEIGGHSVGSHQAPVEVVAPGVIGAPEDRRAAARRQLLDREPGILRCRVIIVPAQARSAMPADVVVRLHRTRSVAEHDHALAAAVLEHEVVAGIRDAAFVIGHQPQMVADEPLVGEIVFLVDVILRRNGVPLAPPARIGHGRRLRSAGRVLQRFARAASGDVAAAVAEALGGRGDQPPRDCRLFPGRRARHRPPHAVAQRFRTACREARQPRRRRPRRFAQSHGGSFSCSCDPPGSPSEYGHGLLNPGSRGSRGSGGLVGSGKDGGNLSTCLTAFTSPVQPTRPTRPTRPV